ncbi:replicative DNA helicase [Acuticoccus sediminis]|uniref:Replicative DNA helicase n=1 Tax=Acuticoccus sediminis TaxID=2184697 RepID=A0A8B2NZA3_9HYPH|nr:replicative DNA helicase [Acuticoccus sediminis]RAI01138.1 replicative DNA helicase [Acuticoccus sediminis]
MDLDAIHKAEQGILGAMLSRPDALDNFDGVLRAEDFAVEPHRKAFAAIERAVATGQPATPLRIGRELGNDIGGMSGAEYLGRCVAAAAWTMSVPDLASDIVEASRLRRLGNLCADVDSRIGGGESSAAILEAVERETFAIAERRGDTRYASLGEAAEMALKLAEAAYHRRAGLSGFSTGLADLDKLMGGLQRSDLVIVAGRPASGKTSLATSMAKGLAAQGLAVAFFSLEMSGEQLGIRLISEASRISGSRIVRGAINEAEFGQLTDASRDIGGLPIFIDQSGGLTIAQLSARARRLRRSKNIQAVVVDYLQLMQGEGKRGQNRVNELTDITMGLKALAKDLDVPVIALSQLSRQVEAREDKRPRLSDLRESGSIEQDADIVMFVYREEYYLAQSRPKEGTDAFFEWEAKMEAAHGKAEIIIAKHRHGPTGTVDLSFDASLTSFGNLERAA